MVLYYGLLALETANKTHTRTVSSARTSIARRKSTSRNSCEKMPSSSNSWIYTEDLKRRFEERYIDYRYIFVPIYIDRKTSLHDHNLPTIIQQKSDSENSWMYSRSLRDHIFNSTTKIPSSEYYVPKHVSSSNQLPKRKISKIKFFKRSSSAKVQSANSLSSIVNPHISSLNNLRKHRIVKEETTVDNKNDNQSISIIKHDYSSSLRTSNDTNPELVNTKSNVKHFTTCNNKLTRLRSFFHK
ncbi:unnamed protein product [Adineta steineri]|uniref:Uncharacterized protein n=1 Tax=Adineta steineri TaxID=433720 RepID=A0A814RVK7_9BILA|nr:unnamed protein product [Adineta steineri]